MSVEREKIEIINLWAVNDIKTEPEIIKLIESLPIEHQPAGVSALKMAYIVGFKKALQHAASYVGSEATALELAKQESQKEYKYANELLKIGTQKV